MAKALKSGRKSKAARAGKKGQAPQTRRLAADSRKQSNRGGGANTPSRGEVKRVVPRMQRHTPS